MLVHDVAPGVSEEHRLDSEFSSTDSEVFRRVCTCEWRRSWEWPTRDTGLCSRQFHPCFRCTEFDRFRFARKCQSEDWLHVRRLSLHLCREDSWEVSPWVFPRSEAYLCSSCAVDIYGPTVRTGRLPSPCSSICDSPHWTTEHTISDFRATTLPLHSYIQINYIQQFTLVWITFANQWKFLCRLFPFELFLLVGGQIFQHFNHFRCGQLASIIHTCGQWLRVQHQFKILVVHRIVHLSRGRESFLFHWRITWSTRDWLIELFIITKDQYRLRCLSGGKKRWWWYSKLESVSQSVSTCRSNLVTNCNWLVAHSDHKAFGLQ